MTSSELLPATVLSRKAVVYVRQSTQSQVMTNLEGQRRQYDLVEAARQRGFVDVEIIDDDLCRAAIRVTVLTLIVARPSSLKGPPRTFLGAGCLLVAIAWRGAKRHWITCAGHPAGRRPGRDDWGPDSADLGVLARIEIS